jgi:hypothetical protein
LSQPRAWSGEAGRPTGRFSTSTAETVSEGSAWAAIQMAATDRTTSAIAAHR